MAVVVYKYGIPRWARLPAVVDSQLRLAHDLRQDLVVIEQQRRERIAAIWSSDSTIATLETRIARAQLHLEEAATSAAKERATRKSKGRTEPRLELSTLRANIKKWKKLRRGRISFIYDAHREILSQIDHDYKRSMKGLYADYCQITGPRERLYWACFNDVVNQHRAAAKRVESAHVAGRRAQLRLHRFDGSGALAVQLQRERGVPPRSPATLADPHGKWRNVLMLAPWLHPQSWESIPPRERRRRRMGAVRLRCGPDMIELPVIVHRMLPADADVTGARLVVNRVAGHRASELHITAKIAEPVAAAGPAVALHLGWRREEDTVRVATWRSTEPLTVPTGLAPWLQADSDCTGGIHVPLRWTTRIDHYDELQAARTVAVDNIRAELVAWLAEHGPAPLSEDAQADDVPAWISAEQIAQWRAARRFAVLALQWRSWQPSLPKAVEMSTALEAWRVQDRRLWESQVNGRARTLGQRDDAYRRVGAWLTGIAGRLVIDDIQISDLARRLDGGIGAEVPAAVVQRTARRRTLAAPGRLRELMAIAAKTRGVEVVTVPYIGKTRLHHSCGHLNPADDRYAKSRVVLCEGCGQNYDQDASTTLTMLTDCASPR